MVRTLQLMLKQKTTIVGMVLLLFFQLTFGIVWMNAYDGVSDRIKDLKVGVVSEDTAIGKTVAEQLVKKLPFHMESGTSMAEAAEKLNDRDWKVVIHIPSDYSANVQDSKKQANLEVLVNESNPQMLKSIGQQVLSQVTANVNTESTQKAVQVALSGLHVPEQQATLMAAGVSNRVYGSYKSINSVSNFSFQMVPMMLVLASYVGAMLLSMNLNASANQIARETTPWQRFWARQVINLTASVVVAGSGTLTLNVFGLDPVFGFGEVFGFLTLTLIAFVAMAQAFLFLFGEAGMFCNIIALSLQLVTSGVMTPRELLSSTFQALGDWFPATYAATGYMNLLFGGNGTADAVEKVLLGTVAALVLSMIGVVLHSQAAKRKNVMETETKVVG
ncbi:ABC transporter permease [Tumebacillus sp. ITR2]|uniref:ABC transporter permease n=1 Tax=Tumebacillus amylolyticus TaxID=2801339 RepID=A0ABS1J7C0_9BACL|nr:ABC transporter permease [Tumebacillus amylolyticus]MBL0386171.1 ABC transporter permease [Tumebacillus amylolyticus]